MAKFERAVRDVSGKVVETPREATGAENSKDSYNVLKTSLILAVIAGVGLALYWGVLPWMHHAAPPT